MWHSARSSLGILSLCLALGIPAASAQAPPSDRTWTDPPARAPDTVKPTPAAPPQAAKTLAPAPPSQTPAAAPERSASRRAPAGDAAAPRRAPRRSAVRVGKPAQVIAAVPLRPLRKAAAGREPPVRARVAVRPRPVHAAPPVLARRPPREERFAGYRGYPPSYGVVYPPGYADDRLERLRAAEAAGYLVVRRRSVEFPDGRSLRTYRPLEDGGFD